MRTFAHFGIVLGIALGLAACAQSEFGGGNGAAKAKKEEKKKEKNKGPEDGLEDDPNEQSTPNDGEDDGGLDAADAGSETGDDTDEKSASKTPEELLEEDGEKSKKFVRSLTGSMAYDGYLTACVDFKSGVVTAQDKFGRNGTSILVADFIVTTKDGKTFPTKAQIVSSGTAKLEGDWTNVTGASVAITGQRRCNADDDADPPTPTGLPTSGTSVCVDLNDEGHDQSGTACIETNWNIQYSK